MPPPPRSFATHLRRALRFPLLRIPLLGGLLFVAMGISNGFLFKFADSPLAALACVLGMIGLALGLYAGFVRLVENRPVTELGLAGSGRELGVGLLLGLGLLSVCFLILALLGIYRIEGMNPMAFLLPALPMALSSSVLEELIHRGVLFRVTEEYLGSVIALTATAAFFGFRHLGNPEATLLGAVFIAIEAGILLAAAFMLTRRLWLAIGIHMGWNYAQAAIFSGTVSGVDMPSGLIRATLEGPDLLTGGAFGVEGSVVAFLICTTAGAILLGLAIRRGGLRPPFWARPLSSTARVAQHADCPLPHAQRRASTSHGTDRTR